MDFSFSTSAIIFFLCALLRISSFLFFLPFFPSSQSARFAKVFLSLVLAFVLAIAIDKKIHFAKTVDSLVILCLQEIAIGAVMGFIVFLLEGAFRMIGGLISQLIGLEIVQSFDPANASSSPLMVNLFFYFGVLILLSLDAHHYLLQIIAVSFIAIPPGSFALTDDLFHLIFGEWIIFCRFTLVIVAPLLLMAFTVSIELGILGRLVPQMNVFLMEYPVRLGAGIFLLAWFLPSIILGFSNLFYFTINIFETVLG